MERDLLTFLQQRVRDGLLLWADQVAAADQFCLPCAQVERVALENDILPARYQRNMGILTCRDQLQLFSSKVAVVGCGGLGGYLIEELTRLGVGQIFAIDPDVFEEHNLNRQLFSRPLVLGRPKVAVAAERVRQINPAVTLTAVHLAFSAENGTQLLKKAQVAVDGLDTIDVRLQLAEVCSDLGIPLVHGAIAGWYGHVTTQFPGESTLQQIYGASTSNRGVERQLGNPSFTPALIASLQVSEVCKLLLGQGTSLRGRTISVDLLDMEFVEVGA